MSMMRHAAQESLWTHACADRIKALRKQSGKSLSKVASEVGVSKTHVWQLETGQTLRPSIDLVMRLADCYGVTVAWLIGEDVPADENPRLLQLIRYLRQLSRRDQTRVAFVVNAMFENHMP